MCLINPNSILRTGSICFSGPFDAIPNSAASSHCVSSSLNEPRAMYRYRHSSSPHLRAQTIDLFFWKCFGERIDLFSQAHGFLPHLQIFMRCNGLITHHSLPITHYPLLIPHHPSLITHSLYSNSKSIYSKGYLQCSVAHPKQIKHILSFPIFCK